MKIITIFWGMIALVYGILAYVSWKSRIPSKGVSIKIVGVDVIQFLKQSGKINAIGFILAVIATILTII